jgi:hypothetical protein
LLVAEPRETVTEAEEELAAIFLEALVSIQQLI